MTTTLGPPQGPAYVIYLCTLSSPGLGPGALYSLISWAWPRSSELYILHWDRLYLLHWDRLYLLHWDRLYLLHWDRLFLLHWDRLYILHWDELYILRWTSYLTTPPGIVLGAVC